MRRRKGNFAVFSGYGFYIPGPGGILGLLLWFLAGAVLGAVVTAIFTLAYGSDVPMEYLMVVSYPLMFIPAMIYASGASKRNCFLEEGIALDSKHWGRAEPR